MTLHPSRPLLHTVSRAVMAIGLVCTLAPGLSSAATSAETARPGESVATFAGGCFWCVESDFDHVPGVLRTISGYTGGDLADPTYRDVTQGGSGHREAVQIVYDPEVVSYETLLEIFWRSVDPTDDGGQFCDRGDSYRTTIFTHDDAQHAAAQASRTALQTDGRLPKPVVTPIEPAGEFYPAEAYHQDYYEKNPVRYRFYRYSCGRDARIEELWGTEAHQSIHKD